MSKADFFLKKTLGEDFLEDLTKFELWKHGTKSVLDHEEIRTALQIVPRTVLAFLIKELTPMQIGDTKEIDLLVGTNARLRVTKHERDVFSGEIEESNKKISEFKLRSLPGIGLVIMSAFELYDMENLINNTTNETSTVESNGQMQESIDDMQLKVQKMIDERLMLHDLIGQVIDKKMMEKEAIHELVLVKLTEAIKLVNKKVDKHHMEATDFAGETSFRIKKLETEKKKRPLKEFLEKKNKSKEFSILMTKGDFINCPDCGKEIFNGTGFSGCICYGSDMNRKVFLKKSEQGIKISFPKSWDEENIAMLLEVLQKKNK